MMVPFPGTIKIGDYEIGHALMNELLRKYPSPDLTAVCHTRGIKLRTGHTFVLDHPGDYVLAQAANILMERGFEEKFREEFDCDPIPSPGVA